MDSKKIKDGIVKTARSTGGSLKRGWYSLMRKLVHFLDPRLEKYREAKTQTSPKASDSRPEIFMPESLADLFWILKKTPSSVLSDEERELIVSAMTFNERKIRDVMLPRKKIVFVENKDILGPLTLDKLYKSGLSHFPVTDGAGKIVGVLHTESLTSLEIKETDTAEKYMDPKVYYVRDDYSLEQAMAAFLRTNCYFFMVVDHDARIVGMTSFESLIKMLLGYVPSDGFTGDSNSKTVANR